MSKFTKIIKGIGRGVLCVFALVALLPVLFIIGIMAVSYFPGFLPDPPEPEITYERFPLK